jgi:hypothetical protein
MKSRQAQRATRRSQSNTQTGVVAAQFQIRAESISEAVKQAVDLYSVALAAAGERSIGGGRMKISEDDVGSLTLSRAHERELTGV